MKQTKPLNGKPLLLAAWNRIAEHPEEWDQAWPFYKLFTGSVSCCLGAHAAGLVGLVRAKQGFHACGLKGRNASYLFEGNRTMPELRARVVQILGTSRGVRPVPKVSWK